MPAKIKKNELAELLYYLKNGPEQKYYVMKIILLQQHGCNGATHDINDQGWIVEKGTI